MPGKYDKLRPEIKFALALPALTLFASQIACNFGLPPQVTPTEDGSRATAAAEALTAVAQAMEQLTAEFEAQTETAEPTDTATATTTATATSTSTNAPTSTRTETATEAPTAVAPDYLKMAARWFADEYMYNPMHSSDSNADAASLVAPFEDSMTLRDQEERVVGLNVSPANLAQYVQQAVNAINTNFVSEEVPFEPFVRTLFEEKSTEKPGDTIASRAQGWTVDSFFSLNAAIQNPEAYAHQLNRNKNVFIDTNNGVQYVSQQNADGTEQLGFQTYLNDSAELLKSGESAVTAIRAAFPGLSEERVQAIAALYQVNKVNDISTKWHLASENPLDIVNDESCTKQRATAASENDFVTQGQVDVVHEDQDISAQGLDVKSFTEITELVRGIAVNGRAPGVEISTLYKTEFLKEVEELGGIENLTNEQVADLAHKYTLFMVTGFTAFPSVPASYANHAEISAFNQPRSPEMFFYWTCGPEGNDATATLPGPTPTATATVKVKITPTGSPVVTVTVPVVETTPPRATETPAPTDTPTPPPTETTEPTPTKTATVTFTPPATRTQLPPNTEWTPGPGTTGTPEPTLGVPATAAASTATERPTTQPTTTPLGLIVDAADMQGMPKEELDVLDYVIESDERLDVDEAEETLEEAKLQLNILNRILKGDADIEWEK